MDNVIEISTLDDLGSSYTDSRGSSDISSGKFGDDISLLMNDKKDVSNSSNNSNDGLDLSDLNQLESELNEINESSSGGGSNKSLFSDTIPEVHINTDDMGDKDTSSSSHSTHSAPPSVRFSDPDSNNQDANTSTWDGYKKFTDIPTNSGSNLNAKPMQSKEDVLREKFQMLRKLETLEHKGVQLSKKYSMESSLMEMKGEYETVVDEKARQNSIKFQGNMLMTCINGIEFLNNRFDPFDVKLDGWSEQLAENVDDYDEVFSELYDKYKSKASMSPELRLLFQLGGSAAMLHMTNTMFKSAMPGMDDVLRQNPDLAKQFQKAAVDSMSGSAPGFSNFMGNMSSEEPAPTRGTGPPPTMATQGDYAVPVPTSRPGNMNTNFNSRPDLARSMNASDGINISENFSPATAGERSSRHQDSMSSRAEMRGPSDIDSILSNLKTKRVGSPGATGATSQTGQNGQSSSPRPPSSEHETNRSVNESSTISISDLKEMQSTSASAPKSSRRRRVSDKNTVSLDI